MDTVPDVGLAKSIPKFQSLSCVRVIGGFDVEDVEDELDKVCAKTFVATILRTTIVERYRSEYARTLSIALLREHFCLFPSIPEG
jgi:hypothetical protein